MTKGIINGCVDPRLHTVLPKAAELMGVEKTYVFRIPGPDGIWTRTDLAEEKNGNLASIRRLTTVADVAAFSMIGHTDCAGHPAMDDEHREHTKLAAQKMKEELGTDKPVYALLAVRGETDDDWTLEQLAVY